MLTIGWVCQLKVSRAPVGIIPCRGRAPNILSPSNGLEIGKSSIVLCIIELLLYYLVFADLKGPQ